MGAEWSVFDPHSKQLVGRVRLNGHSIRAGGPLGLTGAMRSFTLVEGNLRNYWARQQTLRLEDEAGRAATVRVAALPTDKDELGFFEFVQVSE